jgi:hypothetical protein
MEPRRQKRRFVCQEGQYGIPNSEDRVFGLHAVKLKSEYLQLQLVKSNKSSYQIRNPLITVALPSKQATIYSISYVIHME